MTTQEEKLIAYLKQTTPEQLLVDISGGLQPHEYELAIIESIRSSQSLPDEVINVLIQYVLLKADMKLSEAFVNKLAVRWARKGVKTVEQAMEIAKKEHRQYLSWQNYKKVATVEANRDKLNATVQNLVKMYYAGERYEFALGGLETLSEVFGVDLLKKYGIERVKD